MASSVRTEKPVTLDIQRTDSSSVKAMDQKKRRCIIIAAVTVVLVVICLSVTGVLAGVYLSKEKETSMLTEVSSSFYQLLQLVMNFKPAMHTCII